jgi:DNA invertase Pin-like site-specific DNA recombinase
METISEAGVRFQSLSEPWAKTTTHDGKLIMTVFAGIAEFERDLIRERTSAGREAARLRGIHFGRPRKLNPEQTKLARRLIDEGQAVREIANTFNIHTASYLSALKNGGLKEFSVPLPPSFPFRDESGCGLILTKDARLSRSTCCVMPA